MNYSNNASVLQFPSHYIPVEAEEMEYIDGGKYYCHTKSYSSMLKAYSDMNSSAIYLYASSVLTALLSTAIGAILGNIGGAIAGAVGGIAAGSVIWGWASAADNAAMDVKGLQKRGRKSCSITVELNNLTMRISVR